MLNILLYSVQTELNICNVHTLEDNLFHHYQQPLKPIFSGDTLHKRIIK